jgi:hypothetical protein
MRKEIGALPFSDFLTLCFSDSFFPGSRTGARMQHGVGKIYATQFPAKVKEHGTVRL